MGYCISYFLKLSRQLSQVNIKYTVGASIFALLASIDVIQNYHDTLNQLFITGLSILLHSQISVYCLTWTGC